MIYVLDAHDVIYAIHARPLTDRENPHLPQKQKMKKKPRKAYWDMTSEELTEATKEFDREGTILRTKPLIAEMRRKWEKAKKRGRPEVEEHRNGSYFDGDGSSIPSRGSSSPTRHRTVRTHR